VDGRDKPGHDEEKRPGGAMRRPVRPLIAAGDRLPDDGVGRRTFVDRNED
jgi:hypothetical protein